MHEMDAERGGGQAEEPPSMVEVVDDAPPDMEDTHELLENFPDTRQVAVSRRFPEWASGHLTPIRLQPGQKLTTHNLDELAHYYGGGTYYLRPVAKSGGQWLKGARTIRIDGPPLYKGGAHPSDPDRFRNNTLGGAEETALAVPAHTPGNRAPDDPIVALLGKLVERVAELERPPQVQQLQPQKSSFEQMKEFAQMMKMMRDLDGGRGDDEDDDEDEEEEEEPQENSLESMVMGFIEKKLDAEDEEQKAKKTPESKPKGGGAFVVSAPNTPGEKAQGDAVTTDNSAAKTSEPAGLPFKLDQIGEMFSKLSSEQKGELAAEMVHRFDSEDCGPAFAERIKSLKSEG